ICARKERLCNRAYTDQGSTTRECSMSGKSLAIGDTYLPLNLIEPALAALATDRAIEVRSVTPNERAGISEVHEYQGDPDRIAEWTQGADILLVHAAAVTRTGFQHNPQLRIVA